MTVSNDDSSEEFQTPKKATKGLQHTKSETKINANLKSQKDKLLLECKEQRNVYLNFGNSLLYISLYTLLINYIQYCRYISVIYSTSLPSYIYIYPLPSPHPQKGTTLSRPEGNLLIPSNTCKDNLLLLSSHFHIRITSL